MISVQDLISKIPTLAGLPETTLRRIASCAVERRFTTNAALYRAGDAVDGLYMILSGRIRVSRESASRVELLHTEGVGGVLGEIPVFGGGPFPASAHATAPTRCAHLPLPAVQRLLDEDPAFARYALARLAERARTLLRRIDELTASTITARVAAHVLSRSSASGAPFTLGMSQEELARELGTAREVVVRSLRTLVAAGAIGRAGRSRFVVASRTTLEAISGA
jgi:CRP/FNR family transcriptional regulator